MFPATAGEDITVWKYLDERNNNFNLQKCIGLDNIQYCTCIYMHMQVSFNLDRVSVSYKLILEVNIIQQNLPVNFAFPYRSCICGANPNLNKNN